MLVAFWHNFLKFLTSNHFLVVVFVCFNARQKASFTPLQVKQISSLPSACTKAGLWAALASLQAHKTAKLGISASFLGGYTHVPCQGSRISPQRLTFSSQRALRALQPMSQPTQTSPGCSSTEPRRGGPSRPSPPVSCPKIPRQEKAGWQLGPNALVTHASRGKRQLRSASRGRDVQSPRFRH